MDNSIIVISVVVCCAVAIWAYAGFTKEQIERISALQSSMVKKIWYVFAILALALVARYWTKNHDWDQLLIGGIAFVIIIHRILVFRSLAQEDFPKLKLRKMQIVESVIILALVAGTFFRL